jgi:hypothetical protein
MKERQEIEDQILKCEIDLNNEVEMKLMDNKKMAHSNRRRSHHETTEGLKKSIGKMYLLLLSQCTQVLVDMMKQNATWVLVSEPFDPILLFKLIKKFVLKQSDNQYKTALLSSCQSYPSARTIRCQTQPTMINSPLGWKLLAKQEFVTILLTFWTPSVWSCHDLSMKP